MTMHLKFGLSTLFTVLALVPTDSTLPQQTAPPQGMPGATVSPVSDDLDSLTLPDGTPIPIKVVNGFSSADAKVRSEEHTSELQSRQYLVCRLLLEKKKKKQINISSLQ